MTILDQYGQPIFRAGGFNRFTSNLRSWSEAAEKELRCGVLGVVRARCRDLYNNNLIAHGAIEAMVRRTVGAGLDFQPQLTNAEKGRLRDENLALRALFKEFCWDISVKGDKGHRFFKMLARTYFRDGEVFVVDSNHKDLPFSLRFQIVEGDQLPEDAQLAEGVPEGNKVNMGIETNPAGRIVAYHFYDDGKDMFAGAVNRKLTRVPASRVFHWSNSSRYGNPRGIPFLTPAVLLLADDDEFRNATITKAWVQACMTAFISSRDPELTKHDWSPGVGSEVSDKNVDGTMSNQTLHGTPLSYGTIYNLDKNTDVKMVAATSPPQNLAEFTSVIHHAIAAGLGISYLLLTRNLTGVSYSGGRQADNEDRLFFADLSREMDEELIEPIWRKFVDHVYFILRKRPVPAGVVDPYAVQISHPIPRELDPTKQETSYKLALENGSTSRQQIAREKGQNFFDLMDERKEEEDYMAELKLTPAQSPTTVIIESEKDAKDDK